MHLMPQSLYPKQITVKNKHVWFISNHVQPAYWQTICAINFFNGCFGSFYISPFEKIRLVTTAEYAFTF